MRRGIANDRGYSVVYNIYSRLELEGAWEDTEGQGNLEARGRGSKCVLVPAMTKAEALELSALFVRNIFAMPTAAHYNAADRTLSLYLGDSGSPMIRANTLDLVRRYLCGAARPAHGPMFDEGT